MTANFDTPASFDSCTNIARISYCFEFMRPRLCVQKMIVVRFSEFRIDEFNRRFNKFLSNLYLCATFCGSHPQLKAEIPQGT
ncbi:Protein of unknown function [Pyronema omphalodes CBS 100304]|uniref:Uncharacterized protein n=1 Tax=Pyronema omphalodes (strain CBS 100304) TaxID=1076935 RepID=U4L3R5_PYROM|nr:Protein of unknown function [Pyronema omphalodes CBS 100304]